jgi:hypothetical protein
VICVRVPAPAEGLGGAALVGGVLQLLREKLHQQEVLPGTYSCRPSIGRQAPAHPHSLSKGCAGARDNNGWALDKEERYLDFSCAVLHIGVSSKV